MFPILIDFGTWDLPFLGETPVFLATYGLVFALVALTGWIIFMRLALANGLSAADAEFLSFWTILAALAGSKFTLVFLDIPYYLEDPTRILGTLRAAGVLMGGVAAGLLTIMVLSWRRGVSFWTVADCTAVPLALGQAFGRLGCLLAGCCYGRPARNLPWAITFTDPSAAEYGGAPLNVPLHPVQLYQFTADLAVFGIVALVFRRRRFEGQAMLAFLAFYGIDRAILENWRGDSVRGLFFNGLLSTSQILSAIALVVAVALWPYLSRRERGRAR
jgi:phosphatidylglycerol:prolipoprotein diacylglycerol transferase